MAKLKTNVSLVGKQKSRNYIDFGYFKSIASIEKHMQISLE